MERLLNAFERRFGRYAFDNLTLVLVFCQAATLVLSLARPGFAELLMLEPQQVREGQYWRLFSYLFLPPSFDPLWALLGLYFLHLMGTALETQWGAFKYQAYWIFGAVLTALFSFSFDVAQAMNRPAHCFEASSALAFAAMARPWP
jgi:membrane associated rhomboid family serine protease